jgi:hypothetical protein
LKNRQRAAESDQHIDPHQRLHPSGKSVADRQFFHFNAMLLEESAIDPNISDCRADLPAGVR